MSLGPQWLVSLLKKTKPKKVNLFLVRKLRDLVRLPYYTSHCLKPRIADLKVAAQKSLGQGCLRLIAPDGRVLDPLQSLQDAGLQEGDARRQASALECSI